MKSCSKIHPLLSLEAEGALSVREQKTVQTHLRDCADARKELASYKRMRRTLRALPEPKEPGNLHEKIMARLDQEKLGTNKKLFQFRPLWPVAAAATTVFFFIQYPNWQDRMTSQSKTPLTEANRPVAAQSVADKKSVPAAQPASQGNYAFAPVQNRDDLEMAAKQSKDELADASIASGNAVGGAPAAAPMNEMLKSERKELALKPQSAAPAVAMARANSLDTMQGASAAPETKGCYPTKPLFWSGDQDTHTAIAQQSLLTDEASFDTVWSTLEPSKPAPTVDFTLQAVVFLEAGLEPSAGYKVQVLQMEEKPNHFVIHWGDTKPSPDALTSQVVTYPWTLQVIDKPSKPVSFTEDE